MSKSCCKESLNEGKEKRALFHKYREYVPAVFGFVLLLSGIIL